MARMAGLSPMLSIITAYFCFATTAWAERPQLLNSIVDKTAAHVHGDAEFTDAEMRVAIYQDSGVWRTGAQHLRLFFNANEISYRSIDARTIRTRGIDMDQFDLLVMPGGQSWTYLDSLGEVGGEAIRKFVTEGGGYVGICAGAFYALSHRQGGYHTGAYGIGLIDGIAYDGTALGTSPFKVGMLRFSVSAEDMPDAMHMALLEGPSMLIEPAEAERRQMTTIARFPEIDHPAMILFEYGEGRVFLSGPHPEVEEHRLNWGYRDPESDWPLLLKMFEQVRRAN